MLITLLGWSLSASAWGLLIDDRRDDLVRDAHTAANDAATVVAERLDSQLAVLEGIGEQWARFGGGSAAEWRADARLRIETRNGISGLAWIDRDESDHLAVGAAASPAARAKDAAVAEKQIGEPRLLGPDRDDTGALWYRVALPARAPQDHAGVIVAHVALSELLSPLLATLAPGYAISIDWKGEQIYTRDEPSADAADHWWHAETSVALPEDGIWQIALRPTDALATARLRITPHYLLAAGMALSLLLAGVIHQWRLVSRQARFLEAANRALEEKGDDLQRLNVELERRVTDRTERLEDAVSELEAFNYSVSHDLRSPLGAVLNLAAILEEEYTDRPLDADGLQLLSRIQGSATRATALLEDLLQLSRAGQAVLSIEPIDTTGLAREMFAHARAADGDAEVELVLEPLPEVEADRTLLGAVFTNLFTNALKYSRGCEKRRVTVTGRIDDGESSIEVADNGRGFDMRFAGKLFGLFERLHADEDIEGTGVGLALVARIIKRHGGRVWAEGEIDAGARFGFSLPRSGGAAK